MALILGSAFALLVSTWHPGANPQQAADRQPLADKSSVEREPELLANSNPAGALRSAKPSPSDTSGVVPASFDAPQPAPADAPDLMPAADSPAAVSPVDELPAEAPADEIQAGETPASIEPADEATADEAPATESAGDETPAAEAPADKTPAAEAPAEAAPATDAAKQPAAGDRAAEADANDDSPLAWHNNYRLAMQAAFEQQRNMFILFCEPGSSATQQAFEQQALADPRIREKLVRDFVLTKLPTSATITNGGKPVELLKHPAFAEMLGRPGMAIIDLEHPQADYFGHVVSTFPFVNGKYYKRPVVPVVLNLPPGTLTQRTMIYAVRVHPEAPASTQGQFHRVLADEANRQSNHQAAILVQGHQNWETRVHRISARLPSVGSPQEVVAESWPAESLVDACIDCVDSWRHSPGHWEAVRSRHPLFGFDIQRGRNGIWYATGIFGHR
jgi:hypothetical protein